ncbi:ankyrin repeat protein, putative [Trichomonas vaginalis G3]|uniref:Ankyrin repeat protein, putative n=1 Tax=Trichomonas vaginalis (strain ATCC PRA-98 / G3) TaxID=412133 RepID=A2EKQ7_TRIV3|nr:cyclin-dependent kinase inhibitor 2C-related family [Trichomonas vaginalis G3]EAY06796.1 ankyrin repeat protein, putative [Trichomonas vaginalis G3]KAI5485844.1 cyclin-dependent kinase inhibitor 2C-related family [Trichomonas vaginalis G3]|eukprot:XP_001319019.1 ankyrin repeat protein [Trichomonas vaginalis G3]
MSEQDIHPNVYSELRNIYSYYIDSYNALYQLKTENEAELNKIYKMIKTELLDSKKYLPRNVLVDILSFIQYNSRYAKSYLSLAKLIYDESHVKEVNRIPIISNFLFYKEYGIKLCKSDDFEQINIENLENIPTIYRAIMDNDKESFIAFTLKKGFDKNQKLRCKFNPYVVYSLLELCCYHGAVDCFKFLRTEFHLEINRCCLLLSFLGGNPEIMSECLKYQKPNKECMEYAIISHNIDFVTFLMNEYNIKIDLDCCITYNNLEAFLVYFDQTKDVNECFIKSTRFNIPSLCEYFLSYGANINEKDEYGKTALHAAAENNSKETAEFLLSHGANINAKDKYKKTAFHYAAANNSKETIELLILHDEYVDAKDNDGKTALHYAARNNCREIIELLILHGAYVDANDKDRKTALHYASHTDIKETIELLLSHGANINWQDKNGRTALHIAARFNNKETAQLLLLHGANINEKDKYEETALHAAASFNSKETAEFLLSHGANINEKAKYGKTALHIAANKNKKEIVELLLSNGANINEKDKEGTTALQYALANNCKEAIELLISLGANINEADEKGKTALHYASVNNCIEAIEYLISHGANINQEDENGNTALYYAIHYNWEETAKLLISHGAKM